MPKLTLAFDAKGVVVPAITLVQVADPPAPNIGVEMQEYVVPSVGTQLHPDGTEV
jgi:hypothetical protein